MESLIQSLQSADEDERTFAVQDIGEKLDPKSAIPLIKRLVVETSQLVRDSIVFHLKKIPCSGAYDLLFELFNSEDAFLRNAAVEIFGSERDEALAFLTSNLNNADREVRKLILDSLFIIGSYEAILALRAALHDTSVNVKITAAEYLGRLEDKDSADELTALLERDREPMLCSAVLDALTFIAEGVDIVRILTVLGSEEDIYKVDPIYIPVVFRLIARSGNLEFICKIFKNAGDTHVYSDDIMRAIGEAKRRFDNIFEECCILDIVMTMIWNSRLKEDTRYGALELILNEGLSVAPADRLYELGKGLMAEPAMIYGGLRLLAASGILEGVDQIRKLMAETKDESLASLCRELIQNGTSTRAEA